MSIVLLVALYALAVQLLALGLIAFHFHSLGNGELGIGNPSASSGTRDQSTPNSLLSTPSSRRRRL
jgi:hypothetical protein